MGLNKDSQLGFQRTQHSRRKKKIDCDTLNISDTEYLIFIMCKVLSWIWHKIRVRCNHFGVYIPHSCTAIKAKTTKELLEQFQEENTESFKEDN